MCKQEPMDFGDGDLPLFSGTPVTVTPKPASPERQVLNQFGFFKCHVCRDTGVVWVNGQRRRCTCKWGDKEDNK
jgi:hypothetical protein